MTEKKRDGGREIPEETERKKKIRVGVI